MNTFRENQIEINPIIFSTFYTRPSFAGRNVLRKSELNSIREVSSAGNPFSKIYVLINDFQLIFLKYGTNIAKKSIQGFIKLSMMLNRKINIIYQFTAWLFFLAILSQNVVGSPIICLGSEGQVNIEIDCNDIPIQKNNENQDNCFDCIDIPFWNYNSDLSFLVKSADFNFIVHEINHEPFFYVNYSDVSLIFQSIENPQTHLIPFLKYTVLLI